MNVPRGLSRSESIGRGLGRCWRLAVSSEFQQMLVAKGLPCRVVSWGLGSIKLILAGALLYLAFWVGVLVTLILAFGWIAQKVDVPRAGDPELRDGHSGVGLYGPDDWRIDLGDPDES